MIGRRFPRQNPDGASALTGQKGTMPPAIRIWTAPRPARIAAVGAIALLLAGTAAAAEARSRHGNSSSQARAGRGGNPHAAEIVGEKTMIQVPTWFMP